MAIVDLASGYKNFNTARVMTGVAVPVSRYIDTTVNNLASGNVYKIFAYEANTLLRDFTVITETVEGAGDTIDIVDDTSSTNTLCSNADVNTDNAVKKQSTDVFKADAGHICISPDAAITAAKFWVHGTMIKFSTSNDV